MKKFWVGLLSVFILIGGVLFYACGKPSISVTLNQTSVDICLNDDSDHTATVVATVNGISNGTVTASSDDTNIAIASAEYISLTKQNIITITAVNETGPVEILVTDDYSGKVTEKIIVNVYKELKEGDLQLKEEKFGQGKLQQSNFFAVRGRETELSEKNLVSIVKDNKDARFDLVWTVVDSDLASLKGNILTVDEDFVSDDKKLTVRATDRYTGVFVDVPLTVIDPLNASDIYMEYAYDGQSFFENPLLPDTTLSVVSNMAKVFGGDSQNAYGAYIRVHVPTQEGIDICEVVQSMGAASGLGFDQKLLDRPDEHGNSVYEFSVKAKEEEIDQNFTARFVMQYAKFNYGVETYSFAIEARPLVYQIELLDGTLDATLKKQTIYTSYSHPYSVEYGRKYTVKLTPALENLNKRYKIRVDYSQAIAWENSKITADTLHIHFGSNGAVYGSVDFSPVEDSLLGDEALLFEGETTLPASELYFIVDSDLVPTQISGVEVTIISLDNTKSTIATKATFDLYSSAESLNFGEKQKEEKAVLLKTDKENSITKSFVLRGQSSTEGLSVELQGIDEGELAELKINPTGSSVNNVAFDITFRVKNAIGKTLKGSYIIRHTNGLVSEAFDIDLYLPLKEADIAFTNGVAITKTDRDGQLYKLNADSGLESVGSGGISRILMRNGYSAPITATVTELRDHAAQFELSYGYFDYDEKADYGEGGFEGLSAQTIFNGRKDTSKVTSVINSTLHTSAVGRTYLVATFVGRGEDGKEITFVRIILVESYIAPTDFVATPDVISVYAQNSVSDDEVTSQDVTIFLGDQNLTYLEYNHFTFDRFVVDGGELDFGNYKITNFDLNGNTITFTVLGLYTGGTQEFNDTIEITYLNEEIGDRIKLSLNLLINIKNADRIEKLYWENGNTGELYFEVETSIEKSEPQFLIFSTEPDYAKNQSLEFIVTNENGGTDDVPVLALPTIEDKMMGRVMLQATTGMKGYIFVLPADAIYQGTISYYYDLANGERANGVLRKEKLFEKYNHLITEGYFVNNNGEKVSFSQIVVKIPVVVADGSIENPYRIYTADKLRTLDPTKHHVVMNDLTLDGWLSIGNLSGSISGLNENVTLTIIDGDTFVASNSGSISNLRFAGSVTGNGFVANTNNGSIENVTVDVYYNLASGEYQPSLVTGTGVVGGLVGTNRGALKNVNALGVSVLGDIVGGIVGANEGNITLARYEIYNFKNAKQTLKGNTIGGVVGKLNSGVITNAYAYDYTLRADGESIFEGTTLGGLVGDANASATIKQSFAVVNVSKLVGEGEPSIEDVYNSYYSGGEYISDTTQTNPAHWVSSGDGFLSYVNNGKEHLRAFYQEEALSSTVGFEFNSVSEEKNGRTFDKVYVINEKVSLFYLYGVSSYDLQNMDSSASNELAALNTISLAALLKDVENINKLVISSSDANVITVQGTNLIVKNTGETTLTLSSKQDYSISKEFTVKVVYALSKLKTGANEITQISLQRGRSTSLTYSFENEKIYLGSRSQEAYTMLSADYRYDKEHIHIVNGDVVDIPEELDFLGLKFNGNNLNIVSYSSKVDGDTIDSHTIKAYYVVKGLEDYEEAIKQKYGHNFNVSIFDGALELGVSNSELPITPSTAGRITATLRTSKKGDMLEPEIYLNSGADRIKLVQINHDSTGTIYKFGRFDTEARIDVTVRLINPNEEADAYGYYTYKFELVFSVNTDYRYKVNDDEEYTVTITSYAKVGNESFKLVVSKQEFRNLTAQINKVDNMLYVTNYGTVYRTAANSTGEIAPNNSAILSVSINPSFAYYHHMTVTYNVVDGPSIIGALTFEHVVYDGERVMGYYKDADVDTLPNGNGVRFDPETRESRVYFKIWASSVIDKDTTFEITVTFYDILNNPIENAYVTSYLTVSFLSNPTVTVNGKETAILAKGESATVQIQINDSDTSIDIRDVQISPNVRGITIYTPWTESVVSGVRTFTATLYASVNARYLSGDEFTISVTIRRVRNGIEEKRTASATVLLVDFKVDDKNISIKGSDGDTFVTYLGIPTELDFDYALTPASYSYDSSDKTSADSVAQLIEKRTYFDEHKYYADPDTGYYINYELDRNGNPVKPIMVDQNLYYISSSNGQEVSILNGEGGYLTANNRLNFSFNAERNVMEVSGVSANGTTVNMVLRTTVTIGGNTIEYVYPFTIVVRIYSDEDTPLLIEEEDDFYALSPEAGTSSDRQAQDYILMRDLYLTGHQAFDTTYINSLDGNGFTIYLESFDLEPTGELTLALFRNVTSNTTLKNIRVNIYHGGQITVNTARYTQSQIAGFAISNSGVITNCEVVSFDPDTGVKLPEGESGLVVTYTNGLNTQPVYTTGSFTSSVAGFVIANSGSITNSRVGGETITMFTTNQNKVVDNYYSQSLETFTIRAQGSIAGFVLTNSGAIASSFAKNIAMSNESDTPSFDTAGFVVTNNGRIYTSYVEGVKETSPKDPVSRQGSSISSRLGIVAGFVKGNSGQVKDAYSNIRIANDSVGTYRASGFVYENFGTLENCFSASQVATQRYSQMNFSGIDERGNLLATGEYINCYYYNTENYTDDSESKFDTGAILVPDLTREEYFYGFSFNSSSEDGIWELDINAQTITLLEANDIALSNRFLVEGDVDGQYSLPYTTIRSLNMEYGSRNNPIIIRSAKEFVSVTGASTSTYISKWFKNSNDQIVPLLIGTYRLVADIDLAEILSGQQASLLSSEKAFTGTFYGNGFAIDNLSIASTDTLLTYGLFASIEGGNIFNLNLNVDRVDNSTAAMVGVLAGYANGATLVNINVTNNDGSIVRGLNFVGGAVGFVTGDTIIKNVVVSSPTITAIRLEGTSLEENNARRMRELVLEHLDHYRITTIATATQRSIINAISNYSYAGGIFGYVDIYTNDNARDFIFDQDGEFLDEMNTGDYEVSRLRVDGAVNIQAQVVGGLIGFSGHQTDIKDAGITINAGMNEDNSLIFATNYYAGGVVGHAKGNLIQLFSEYSADIQNQIESNLSSYYSAGSTSYERGSLSIFARPESEYQPDYVGGLVGFAESGTLKVSYSKLNVINTKAIYAGGLVGAISSTAPLFYIDCAPAQATDGRLGQNYLINEAYATGDVRAQATGGTGGIVGAILRGTITLDAVNSANFFSVFNYEAGSNYALTNFEFEENKIYSIAGNVGSSVKLNYKQESIDISGPDATSKKDRLFATVGVVKKYTINNAEKFILSSPKEDGTVDLFEDSKPFLFRMPDISGFKSPADGYIDTYSVFLGSDWWDISNWSHKVYTLYPTIRLSLAEISYIYLDAYDDSIREVLDYISKNPGTEVRVRGRNEYSIENGEEYTYSDVDLRPFLNNDKYGLIEGYNGLLTSYHEGTKDGSNYPGIILDTPMFKSVGEGFRVQNLEVIYDDGDYGTSLYDSNNKFVGAFVNGGIKNGSISNMTMTFNVSGSIKLGDGNSNSVGLLATELINTSIYGLNITVEGENANTFVDTTQVNTSDVNSSKLSYVGLVAGKVTQSSSRRVMNLTRINVVNQMKKAGSLLNTADLVGLEEQTSYGTTYNAYVGGLFGKIERTPDEDDEPSLDLNLYVGYVKNYSQGEETPAKIYVAGFSGNREGNLYVGGYAGYINGASNLNIRAEGVYGEPSGLYNLDIVLTKSINGSINGNAHVGTLVGRLEGVAADFVRDDSTLSANRNYSYLSGTITTDNTTGTVYVGGIAGDITGGSLNIGRQSNTSAVISNISTNINAGAGTAYVGGYVGRTYSTAELNISQNIENNAIVVTAGDAYVGGLIGSAEPGQYTVGIKGHFISSTDITLNGSGKTGGLIGRTGASTLNITGEGGKVIEYAGTITANASTAVGGIVGLMEYDTDYNCTVAETAFGGKIQGEIKGNSFIGGTVAQFLNDKGKTNLGLKIQNNYNYGDIFITKANSNSAITFGGIVGQMPTATLNNGSAISENYSLVTYNVPMRGANDSALHAMFGASNDKVNKSTNYYNHAVCLLTDDNATDAGYKTKYENTYKVTGGGYNPTSSTNVNNKVLADVIAGVVGSKEQGHKLNPMLINNGTAFSEETIKKSENTFHGMTYYYVNGGNDYKVTVSGQAALDNVAIIGDTFTLEYTSTGNIKPSLITSMSNNAFISGVNISAKIESDDVGNMPDYSVGGLVGKMNGGIIYAVGVTGEMSVGGSANLNLGGIVGRADGGLIAESFSDIHVLYRAGGGGRAAAIVGYTRSNVDQMKILNTYATGTVECYIDVQIDGFSICATGTSAEIRDCYTSANLEWHEYTKATTENASHRTAFSGASVAGSGYVKDATDDLSGAGTGVTTANILSANKDNPLAEQVGGTYKWKEGWTRDSEYNYGYPTRQFRFLKTSSYFGRETSSNTFSGFNNNTVPKFANGNFNYATAEEAEKGIITAKYTRLAGKQLWDTYTSTKYYAVPNAGVWRNAVAGDNGTTKQANVILRNDLHLNYLSSVGDVITVVSGFSLDGQGHRIYGLGNSDDKTDSVAHSMFDTLTKATIINLDILNANVNASGDNGAILANTISDGLYSNITLSGLLSGASQRMGSLAGTSKGATIHSVMSNVKIDLENFISADNNNQNNINAGGVVGWNEGTSIAYCVNNGPINVSFGNDNEVKGGLIDGNSYGNRETVLYPFNSYARTARVGGIAGYADKEGVISFSYNTASVTAGYINDKIAEYNVGGIVGAGDANINNCYNSGMVKSGNKSNGFVHQGLWWITTVAGVITETQPHPNDYNGYSKGTSVPQVGYVGGIIGYTSGGTISNNINEGPVEALGKNPENFTYELRYFDVTKGLVDSAAAIFESYDADGGHYESNSLVGDFSWYPKDLDDKGAYSSNSPYLVGYKDSIYAFLYITTDKNRNVYAGGIAGGGSVSSNNVINNSQIQQNGIYTDTRSLPGGDSANIINMVNFMLSDLFESKVTISPYNNGSYDSYLLMEFLPDVTFGTGLTIFGYTHEIVINNTLNSDDIVVTSVDALGAPTSLYIKTSRAAINSAAQIPADGNKFTRNDYRAFDLYAAGGGKTEPVSGGNYTVNRDTYEDGANVGTTLEGQALTDLQSKKKEILAAPSDSSNSNTTIKIGDKDFYLVSDGNSFKTIAEHVTADTGIILTRNLSLGEQYIFDFNGTLNGNDYTISYYKDSQQSFTALIDNNQGIIKDVSVVAQLSAESSDGGIKHSAALTVWNRKEITNVSTYGNIRNVAFGYYDQYTAGVMAYNYDTAKNIKNYVSINGLNQTSNYNTMPSISGIVNINSGTLEGKIINRGMLIAGNGVEGFAGMHGGVDYLDRDNQVDGGYGTDGRNGGTGTRGGDVYAIGAMGLSNNPGFLNEQYIFGGRGGNAGRGGHGGHGIDWGIYVTIQEMRGHVSGYGYGSKWGTHEAENERLTTMPILNVSGGNGGRGGGISIGGNAYLYGGAKANDGDYLKAGDYGASASAGNGGRCGFVKVAVIMQGVYYYYYMAADCYEENIRGPLDFGHLPGAFVFGYAGDGDRDANGDLPQGTSHKIQGGRYNGIGGHNQDVINNALRWYNGGSSVVNGQVTAWNGAEHMFARERR